MAALLRRSFVAILLLALFTGSCQEVPLEPEPIDLSASKPRALNDTLQIIEDDSTFFFVLVNDSVQSESQLRISEIVDPPQNGLVRIEGDQLFYRPERDFFGKDSLHYSVSAGFLPDTATVIIDVLGAADNPVAQNDTLRVDEDSQSAPILIELFNDFDVLANDFDPDMESLVIVSLTSPSHGRAQIKQAGGSISYFPSENFAGSDRFTYVVNDPTNRTSSADVIVMVTGINDPPVAIGDAYEVQESTALTIDAPGILFNDQDPDDGDSLTAELVTDVANGTVVLDSDGGFVYTPEDNFFGQDRFFYRVSDGQAFSNEGTVLLNVNNQNGAPIAVPDTFDLDEDTQFESPFSVTDNDSDPDGDNVFAIFVDDVTKGQLSFSAGGRFLYIPDPDFFGEDSFTYHASDGSANSPDVKVTLNVKNVNDLPVAQDDAYETSTNLRLEVPAPGVLTNDEDKDGDNLTATRVMNTSNGSLILGIDGSLQYTPSLGFAGEDIFTYLARDAGGSSSEATVRISVLGNSGPIAVADTFSVVVDQTLTIDAPGVLANDTDAEGDDLTASLLIDVTNGVLDLEADGSFTYTPDTGFNGEDSFRYEASDGLSNSIGVDVILNVQ